jgi:hypothetical protein
MNTNIELSGLKRHFFCETAKNTKNNKNKTKIVNYCFYSINEVSISNKIKKIPYYSNYFSVIEEYDFINISTIREKVMEKVALLDENKKYLLFQYKNYLLTFDDFLLQFKYPKILILHVMNTFSYLLQSLIQIQDKNLCFFQFHSEFL